MESQFKITEKVIEAYEKANDYGKEILEGIFGKEAFSSDIRDKIKTWLDAVEILGIDNKYVKEYLDVSDKTCAKDIIAFARLKVIAEALNEGWIQKFDDEEYRYYPLFKIYTKEEYEELDEDEKKACRVVDHSSHISNASNGIAFAYADRASSCSSPFYGYRLEFKTRELAEYCGKQFIDIWKDYLLD